MNVAKPVMTTTTVRMRCATSAGKPGMTTTTARMRCATSAAKPGMTTTIAPGITTGIIMTTERPKKINPGRSVSLRSAPDFLYSVYSVTPVLKMHISRTPCFFALVSVSPEASFST